MTCIFGENPDGTRWVACSRGSRATCKWCGREADLLCDHSVNDKTCDAPVCSRCATHVGALDYCPPHGRFEAKRSEALSEAPVVLGARTALVVNTARMGYRGPDWLDVTRQGNEDRVEKGERGGHQGIGLAFAPSWSLVRLFQGKTCKEGRVTDDNWASYVDAYTDEMRVSYRLRRGAWDKLLAMPHVVLLCFCTDAEHCHRRVLAGILTKLGAHDRGELPPPQGKP